ncbi:MAG: DUF4097 family beta strand repeat-containing protein [Eubacterium sp.]
MNLKADLLRGNTETIILRFLSVPRGLKKISINSVSGSLKLDGVSVSSVDIKTVSGKVNGSVSDLESVKIVTVSGKVKFDLSGNEMNCDISTVSGKSELSFSGLYEAKITSFSGAQHIVLRDRAQALYLNSASSNVTVDAEGAGGVNIIANSGSGKVVDSHSNPNGTYVEARTKSGKIEIK